MFGNNVTSSWANPQQNQQPQQNPSAFGQTGAFGTGGKLIIFSTQVIFLQYPTSDEAFGSGNAFGQNPQPQANPMFGNLAANPNPGTNTGFGKLPSYLRVR